MRYLSFVNRASDLLPHLNLSHYRSTQIQTSIHNAVLGHGPFHRFLDLGIEEVRKVGRSAIKVQAKDVADGGRLYYLALLLGRREPRHELVGLHRPALALAKAHAAVGEALGHQLGHGGLLGHHENLWEGLPLVLIQLGLLLASPCALHHFAQLRRDRATCLLHHLGNAHSLEGILARAGEEC